VNFVVRVDCIIYGVVSWNLLWGCNRDKTNIRC